MFFSFYSSLGLPLAISAFWSIWQLQNRQARVISFYFFSSLLIGVAFAGGVRGQQQYVFRQLLCYVDHYGCLPGFIVESSNPQFGERRSVEIPGACLALFVCGLHVCPVGRQRAKNAFRVAGAAEAFETEVSFLAAQPGPAICESLILCYDAGKPYILDPFNSASSCDLGNWTATRS